MAQEHELELSQELCGELAPWGALLPGDPERKWTQEREED